MKTKLIQKIKEEIEEIVDHEMSCATNAYEVADEFSVLPCSCGSQEIIDKLEKLVEKAISQSKEELVEEIKKILKVEMCPQIVGICSRHETHDIEILLKRLLEDLNKK